MTLNPNEAPSDMLHSTISENSYQHNCRECKKLFTGQKGAVACDKCVAEKALIHARRCRLHTDSGHSYGPVAGCHECAAEASGLRDPVRTKQTLVAMQSALLKESSAKTITISAELSDAYVALLRAAEYLRLTHSKLDETFYAKQCYEGAQVIVDESLKQVIRAGG